MLCANEPLMHHWYPVARSFDVQGGPVPVTVLGRRLVLWRAAGGEVTAVPDRCPHREAPLSAGSVADGCLVCPYHGWTFDGSGRCVRIPSATEGTPVPPRARITPVFCQERYGLVWVCLAEPTGSIPAIEQDGLAEFRRINTPVEVWRTSATRMTDNFLDISHFPFVHLGTFGIAQETVVAKVELQQLDADWYGYRYEVNANNDALGSVVSEQRSDVVHRRMNTGFVLPFNVRSEIHYEHGLSHILLLLSTPIDDTTAYFTFVVWRNDDFSIPTDEVIRFDLAIGAEDRRMLEQLDGVLPLDQTTLVSVQADRCSVEWRRRLAALMYGSANAERNGDDVSIVEPSTAAG